MKKIIFTALLGLFVAAQPVCTLASENTPAKEKEAKGKKAPKTFEELWGDFSTMKSTNDADINAFIASTGDMAKSFKDMSDEFINIKIETQECEDTGDGVTTAVIITDAEGKPRTKEAVLKSNLNTIGNCVDLTAKIALAAATGTNLISSIISNPTKAISMAMALKQLKLTVSLLAAMTREVPEFVENVKTQNALLKQAKQI